MVLFDKKQDISCWVITEGMVGTENQCLGVTNALGIKPQVLKISLSQPWKTLTPWLRGEMNNTFEPHLTPPWPDLLITAGRKAIAASRYIKKKSKGKTFTVHLQDPKCSPKHFDLVAVPHHDKLRGQNVIVTDGAPNRISGDILQKAQTEFAPFGKLSSPRIAVLIGGNSRTHQLTADTTQQLAKQLQTLEGSLMVTASRRTGEENLKILRNALKGGHIYFWDGKTANPYQGMLAWADFILVTEDSVSMISDACSTGKPVFTIPMEGKSKRFDKFHAHMREIGTTRPFDGVLEDFSYPPLQDARKIADTIESKLGIS